MMYDGLQHISTLAWVRGILCAACQDSLVCKRRCAKAMTRKPCSVYLFRMVPKSSGTVGYEIIHDHFWSTLDIKVHLLLPQDPHNY
ncbi:hypothetical protein E2C01_049224 [Portunus trituberculatus]|uniref:Uncharacterized protein n=1 Tax=Portunus trituberculatus TaxID=210409 RepID=A0A5B7G8U8_PORTR|nr:hypothetical protein [Portunus trituberculatus]